MLLKYIEETFFKSIMIVVGSLAGVVLTVVYFKTIERELAMERILLGAIRLNKPGAQSQSGTQYLTDIGLRYLSIPIFTIGLGHALGQKS
ncbi:MAG TPA: hypothetical protein HA257_01560 [Candidatus Methanoperedenaceae archaeon]|nr:hypothetical protein [Candidatus Methanoperedenaceae archaeon]